MPVNKNAMTRYKILDELLSNRYHNYSLDDLTEEVCNRLSDMDPKSNGVTRRTIELDLHYLEWDGPFYVEIERYTVAGFDRERQKDYAKKCLRYKNPSFSIFKKKMTSDEEYLLGQAMSLLGQFDGLPNFEVLEDLRQRLDLAQPERQIISFTKNPLVDNPSLLGEIFTAISHRQVIELHYHKFDSSETDLQVNLHPYLLKEYNRRWYIFGGAERDNKLLNFCLDRINKVVPLPSHRYVEYDGDLNEVLDDVIGVTVYEDSKLYPIVFWVSDHSKDYVATKPIHGSQRNIKNEKEAELREAYPQLKGGRFFQIECKFNYELIRELTSFGNDLLVLNPSDIQDKIWEKVSAMYEDYSKLRTKNS